MRYRNFPTYRMDLFFIMARQIRLMSLQARSPLSSLTLLFRLTRASAWSFRPTHFPVQASAWISLSVPLR